MKVSTVVVALALLAPLGAVASSQTPPVQNAPDITLTGCLVQGSTESVVLFTNAKKDPANAAERGSSYVVVAGTEDLTIREHLNHKVRITGQSDGKIPPAGSAPPAEKDLPTLTAKSLTMVADSCSALGPA